MISMKLLQRRGIALVALVMLVLALAVPGVTQAQSPPFRDLVSNQFTGQDGAHYIVGANPGSQSVGQRFRTGTGTIHLTQVDIFHYGKSVAEEHRSLRRFRVRLCGVTSSIAAGVTYYSPTGNCRILTAPTDDFGWTGSSSNSDRRWTGYTRFASPTVSTSLSASSNYFVVIDQFTGKNSLKTTNSNDEDSGGLAGWSIYNGLHHPLWGEWDTQRSSLPTDNLRIRMRGTHVAAQVTAPTIEGTPALSEAGSDGEWTSGETVDVALTFSEEVSVDTTSGTPSIGIELGSTEARSASYASGSGTTELVFSYTLTDADGSHSSMLVPGDSLTLNGGTITSVSSGGDAALGHNGAGRASTGGL